MLAKDKNSSKEKTTLIEKETIKRGLDINEHKIEYVTVDRGRKQVNGREVYKFKTVDNFKYHDK